MEKPPFADVRAAAAALEKKIFDAVKEASNASAKINAEVKRYAKGVRPEIIKLLEPNWQNFNFYENLATQFEERVKNRIDDCPHKVDPNRLLISMRNIKMYGSILESVPNIKMQTEKFSFLKKDSKTVPSSEEILHVMLYASELIAVFGTGMHHYGHPIGSTTGLIIGFLERRRHARIVKEENILSDFSDFLDALDEAGSHFQIIASIVYRVPDFWPKHADKNKQLKHRKFMEGEAITADEAIGESEASKHVTSMMADNHDYLVSNSLSLSQII